MTKPTIFRNWILLIPCGVLLCVLCLAYLPALSGPLVFDDHPALTTNSAVQIDGRIFDQWRTAAQSSDSGPLQRKLAMATFAANHAFTGGFHRNQLKAVNFAIHLLCGWLLYRLSRLLLGVLNYAPDRARVVALGAAAIWLAHPLHVTTVLYVVQRMAQLSTLFVLTGLLVFAHYRVRWLQRGAANDELLAALLWLGLTLYLGMYCKENAALLLWLIPVLEVTIFRGRWDGRDNPALRRFGWSLAIAPVVLVGLLFAFKYDAIAGAYAERNFTLEQRLLSQPRVLWQYMEWLLLPDISTMGFLHDDFTLSTGLFSPPSTAWAFLSWGLLLAVAWTARNRYPLLFFSVLVFLVGHSLESSFLALEMVYEHRNYLPSVGICLALAALLYGLGVRLRRLPVALPLICFLAVLSSLTWLRANVWTNEVTLTSYLVDRHPDSARSHYNLAHALVRALRAVGEDSIPAATKRELQRMAEENFLEFHRLDPGPAGLITLYVFSSSQGLDDPEQWLDLVPESLVDHRLQATDYNSTLLLFECLDRGDCAPSLERVQSLFDALLEKSPRNVTLLVQKYRALKLYDRPAGEILPLLERALEAEPSNFFVNGFYLQALVEQGRTEEAFRVLLHWLRADRERRSLGRILKSLSIDPAQG